MVIHFTERDSALQGLELHDRIVLYCGKKFCSAAQTELRDKAAWQL